MIETLNHFGWKIITALSIVVLTFTVISYSSAWWIIDYLHHCEDEVHLVVYVRYGVCGVSHTGGISKNDCIKWNEEHEWEQIDHNSRAHTNTRFDANVTYPVANIFIIAAIAISALQLTVCCAYIKFKTHIRLQQYLTVFLNTLYVLLTFWVGMTGGKSDIVRESTWSPYTPCQDGYSYPFTAYYALSISCVSSGVVLLFAVLPGQMSCLHLVDYIDEEVSEGGAKSTGDCPATSPVHIPSIQYADNSTVTNAADVAYPCRGDVDSDAALASASPYSHTNDGIQMMNYECRVNVCDQSDATVELASTSYS